ncbi:AC5 protein [Tomato mottle wrinkle virus]|uniref:AC5 protein n=1 Tax=Tomato mottle wrinkle virus TaxID=1266458 RepID=R4IQU6_9GEMI|nr:AC5 protein [Tomato mottle wrinkle virus]AFZ40233.1 AC5 protein [Tomato mottle wrinkle virus]
MVVDHMIIDLPETTNKSLLVACILSSRNLSIEPMHDLIPITKIVLHSGSTRLIIKHIKHLAKIHRCPIRSPIPNQPENDAVRVVLQFNIFVHPYLP